MQAQKNKLEINGYVRDIKHVQYDRIRKGELQNVKRYDLTIEMTAKYGQKVMIVVSATNSRAYVYLAENNVAVGDFVDIDAIVWPIMYQRKDGSQSFENLIYVRSFLKYK